MSWRDQVAALKPVRDEILNRRNMATDYPLPCPFCGQSAQGLASIDDRAHAHECAAHEMDEPCPVHPQTDWGNEEDALKWWNDREHEKKVEDAFLAAFTLLEETL